MTEESRRSDVLVPILAASSIAAAAWIGRGTWFYSDDWDIYAYYHSGNLLEPFNGHLSLIPAGIYQILFHTVGLGSYLPYRLCGLLSLVILAFQVARFARNGLTDASIGGRSLNPWAAALVVASILWNPSGTMILLFPFLMNFTLPIAALIAIWWHLDRRTDRTDVAASAWLCVALATSGLGLMAAAAVAAELIIQRAPLRRVLIMAPGPLLWAIWFGLNREANDVSTDLVAVGSYCARMFLGATTSLAGGWKPGGAALAVGFVVYVALATWRWRSMDARAVAALTAPLTFIVFTAITRIEIVPHIAPDELRYSWTVAAYLVLVVVVMARPRAMFAVKVPLRVWLAAGSLAVLMVVIGGVRLVPDLIEWNEQVSSARPGLTSIVAATQVVGVERVDPELVIPLSYVPVTARAYLEAVAAVGSPIAGAPEVAMGGGADTRSVSDRILVSELPIRVVDAPPTGLDASLCSAAQGHGIARSFKVSPGRVVALAPSPHGYNESTKASPAHLGLLLERFAPPGTPQSLPVPVDRRSWVVIPDDAPSDAPIAFDYVLTAPPGITAEVCG